MNIDLFQTWLYSMNSHLYVYDTCNLILSFESLHRSKDSVLFTCCFMNIVYQNIVIRIKFTCILSFDHKQYYFYNLVYREIVK